MPTTSLTPLRTFRWCVLVLVGVLVQVAGGNQAGFGYEPHGFQRGPACDMLPPSPTCAPPVCPPRCQGCRTCQACPAEPRSVPDQPRDAAAPRSVAPPSELRETGFYQAGPRGGALEGGHSTFGFRGGALTLPKVRLELPTLELPSFFRTSYAAKMRVAESEAPWTSTGFQRVTYAEQASQGRGADPQPDARDTAQPRAAAPADDADLKAQYEAKLKELTQKIEACEQMRQKLEQSLHYPPQYVPAPQCPPVLPPGSHCAPLPHAATPHASGSPQATAFPPRFGLPPNDPQQSSEVGPALSTPPGTTAPSSLSATTVTTSSAPPPRGPEEVRAQPAEPIGGNSAGWRFPDAAARDRAAVDPRPADGLLPAPQAPRANPFDAPPAATRPWQPLPQPPTAWLPSGDAHTASTAVATRPQAYAKPQRLPSR